MNPLYALDQLRRALAAGRPERVSRWRRVLIGMADGSLRHGSRTPVEQTPAWVTLEVVHGGFATGGLAAGGAMRPHETALLARLGVHVTPDARSELNAHYRSERGRAELGELLDRRAYRVDLPEEAALLVAAWLAEAGDEARASRVLEAIEPFADRLRFYPRPAEPPFAVDERAQLRTVGQTAARLRARRPNTDVATMNETLRLWTPLYDRAVELFLETVEGEAPSFVDDDGDGRVLRGGWPCRRYAPDWAERARALLAEYAELRREHRRSGRPERPKDNFARLRGYLEVASVDPAGLTGRDVGMLRTILAGFAAAHGAPGSERRQATRVMQARLASAPGHHELAAALAGRLDGLDPDGGVEDLEPLLAPLALAHGQRGGTAGGIPVPAALAGTVERTVTDSPEGLVERGLIRSSEHLAVVVPRLTAAVRAGAIRDERLRALYFASATAFARRRSLLLLDLQRQVRLRELPWMAAVDPWIGADDEDRAAALEAARRVWRLALTAFPQTIVPNRLVRELRGLVAAAELRIPLVDELAADIFMDDFGEQYLRAAQRAAALLEGTLYARYYDVPTERLLAIDDVAVRWGRTRTSAAFAALCVERAGDAGTGHSWVARNGAIVEQAQILTTHNLAPLTHGLGLQDEVAAAAPDLARACFTWLARRLERPPANRHARRTLVKNAAYAWRQTVYLLSLAGDAETTAFLAWSREHLATAAPGAGPGLEPALEVLDRVARGVPRGGSPSTSHDVTPACFLGWTTGRHWLLPDARKDRDPS